MPEYIEIDPEGDVILVLATVEEEEESVNDFTDSWSRVRAPPKPDLTETESSTTNKKGKRKGRKRYQCILCSRLITDGDVHICGSLDTNEEPAAANYVCVKCLAEFNNAGDLHRHYGRDCLSPVQKEPPNHTDSPTAEDTAINSETVMPSGSQESRVRVSSKHLSLSSSVFKALFSRKFSEGGHLRTKGSIELPLPDDHSAALLILLNLVHGRIRRVPKILGLDMLTQVAVLVDKYDMGEAVTLFSEIWISEINEKIPAIMSESVVQWICISWVFDRRREFKAATRVAQNFAESTIDKYAATALPIPSMVIDAIESTREAAISEIIGLLHGYLSTYRDSKQNQCSFCCDSMVLGSIIKNLNSLSLLDDPGPPYEGYSFAYLQEQISHQEYPTSCERGNSIKWDRECTSIKPAIERKMNELAKGRQGLNIADMK